jgi:peptidoglycan/xylan/chitin deacetylase (PgdA/CDA1 family)
LEKTLNLEIAQRLRVLLEDEGYRVLLIRDSDRFVDVEHRPKLANQAGAAVFVSIHQNAHSSGAHGVETWYDDTVPGKGNYDLARLIQESTVKATGASDRGLWTSRETVVLRETAMPSCLIETGFITSGEELALLENSEYQDMIARGIAEGIRRYLEAYAPPLATVDSIQAPGWGLNLNENGESIIANLPTDYSSQFDASRMGDTDQKTLYLTFDDGPSAKHTGAILDELKLRGIKATFFVLGDNARKNPELVRRIADEGHTIGIHGYSHVYRDIYASVAGFAEDFEKALGVVMEITGTRPVLFRFPGGSVNTFNRDVFRDIIEDMTERGYIYFDWNASLEDALKNPNAAVLLENAKNSAGGKSRVVMLAHDTVSVTAEILPELLDLFSDYRIEPLTAAVRPVQFAY